MTMNKWMKFRSVDVLWRKHDDSNSHTDNEWIKFESIHSMVGDYSIPLCFRWFRFERCMLKLVFNTGETWHYTIRYIIVGWCLRLLQRINRIYGFKLWNLWTTLSSVRLNYDLVDVPGNQHFHTNWNYCRTHRSAALITVTKHNSSVKLSHTHHVYTTNYKIITELYAKWI